VVAEFDESAAVGCGVDVGVRVVMARVGFATGGFGIVLVLGVLGTTGEGAEEQHGERSAEGGLHAVKLSGRGGMASGQWRLSGVRWTVFFNRDQATGGGRQRRKGKKRRRWRTANGREGTRIFGGIGDLRRTLNAERLTLNV
jgi:hypothetical protein